MIDSTFACWVSLDDFAVFVFEQFGSYLFGMSDVVAKQSAEANTPLNIKNLHLG